MPFFVFVRQITMVQTQMFGGTGRPFSDMYGLCYLSVRCLTFAFRFSILFRSARLILRNLKSTKIPPIKKKATKQKMKISPPDIVENLCTKIRFPFGKRDFNYLHGEQELLCNSRPGRSSLPESNEASTLTPEQQKGASPAREHQATSHWKYIRCDRPQIPV